MPLRDHIRGTDAADACLHLPSGHAPLHWFAVRVKSNREFQVQNDLMALHFETFLPTWSEQVRWSDRTKTTVRPLFPGYLFARFGGAFAFFTALCTRGVVQILPNSNNPLAISDAEIENVRRVMASGLTSLACCDYEAGDLVTIDSGPLAGVTGTVKRTQGAMRVVVGIEILNRAVAVTVDAGTLVKRTEPM